MRSIMTMILLLTIDQASAGEQVIDVQHDSVRGVTCWILNNTGISCLPDSSLLQQTAPAHDAGRASQASSTSENEPLVASPLPQKKGFQL